MKKSGVLHAELSKCLAALGHKDLYMIGDAGMPIPPGVQVIDLAVKAGVPTFAQVLNAVLSEVVVEHFTLAEEIVAANPVLHQYIVEQLPQVTGEYIPHEELKKLSQKCRFAIRTGEFSPYPNVILTAGVAF